MRNVKDLRLSLEKADDKEPLFTLDKEDLPMHIKYITIQMPSVHIQRQRTNQRLCLMQRQQTNQRLCLCSVFCTIILLLSVAVVLTLRLLTQDSHNHLLKLLNDSNFTSHTGNMTVDNYSFKYGKAEDRQPTTKTSINFVPCRSICRKYSAFKFRSSCEKGRCRCHSPFYNTITCLPDTHACAIKQFRKKGKKIGSSQSEYTCNTASNSSKPQVHVISMYGKTQKDTTLLKVLSSNSSTNTEVILVLANFLKTEWIIHTSNTVKVLKIYMVSNKYLRHSSINTRHMDIIPNVIKLFSPVGYGEDRFGGSTVELLRNINDKIGHISSFNGKKYSSEWLLNV